MAMTASDALVERLLAWGVDTVFGLPGDAINGVIEAFRARQERLRFIQTRHGEAAAFAACAYAKFTGRLGVCVATSGPGAIHLLNGLYDAKMDGAPVLAITGQQYSDLLGSFYQQEINVTHLYSDVATYNVQAHGPGDVANLVNTACRIALAQRTVTHINIPIDYQTGATSPSLIPSLLQKLEPEEEKPAITADQAAEYQPGFYAMGLLEAGGVAMEQPAAPIPSPSQLQLAADILNSGSRVAILAGHGAIHAGPLLEKVAETLGAPIVKALLGKGAVSDDSPFTTGGLGLLGTAPSETAMEECDTLLIIGSSFPYASYLPDPSHAHGVQIDIDPTRIGLRYPVEAGLVGDAFATLDALLPLLKRKEERSFLERMQHEMGEWNARMDAEGERTSSPMKPQVVARTLDKLVAPNAIITGDVGINTVWLARNFRIKHGQMFSLSGNLSSMGSGLPYAIGAQVAYPNRQVVAFVGDGGFTMLMGEILTAVKHHLPIKVIILKNNILGQIKWEQVVFLGAPEFAVDLEPGDFAAWARAAGAHGFTCDDPVKIEEIMRQFLVVEGPAVLEAVVDPSEPPLPAKISPKHAARFTEALLRGQPQGSRIALTAFRDKIDNVLH